MSKCHTISSYIVKRNLAGLLPSFLHRASEFMVRICRIFHCLGWWRPLWPACPLQDRWDCHFCSAKESATSLQVCFKMTAGYRDNTRLGFCGNGQARACFLFPFPPSPFGICGGNSATVTMRQMQLYLPRMNVWIMLPERITQSSNSLSPTGLRWRSRGQAFQLPWLFFALN